MEQANGGFYLRELSRLSFFAMENLFQDFSFSPFILLIYLLGKGVFGALENGMKQHTHPVQRRN